MPNRELVAAILGARVHVDIVVPRTSITGRMRLLSQAERSKIQSEARIAVATLGAEGANVDLFSEFREEKVVRSIAIAIRDPADESRPLADLADWIECDEDQLAALWERYQDLSAALDPLGANVEITEIEVLEIEAAAKKKDLDLLTSYGSRKLARYAITSGAPPVS